MISLIPNNSKHLTKLLATVILQSSVKKCLFAKLARFGSTELRSFQNWFKPRACYNNFDQDDKLQTFITIYKSWFAF